MTDSGLSVNVTVVSDGGADEEEISSQRLLVRSMLVESDFDVSDEINPAPQGAKAADAVTINSLVVALAASGGTLATLIGALQAWLLRSSARHVVVELDGDRLELHGVTTEERQRLTDAWLDRHRPVADEGRSRGQ